MNILKNNNIFGVCWIITTECNMNCPICYAYNRKKSYNPIDKKKTIDKLYDYNIKKINFSGGEPLLVENIIELIKYAKLKGIITELSTNGLLLNESILKMLDGYLDSISLPIDGSNPFINKYHRNSINHLDIVKNKISLISKYSIKLNISTVISCLNYNDIAELSKLLISLNVNKWKIFQFFPLGKGRKNEKRFEISNKKYSNLNNLIVPNDYVFDIDFRIAGDKAMSSYLNISPVGDIIIVKRNKYCNIGNIFNIIDINYLNDLLVENSFNFNIHYKRHYKDNCI